MDLSSISALAEFERLGLSYEAVGDTEVKCKCPFHEDTIPSCSINILKNVFKCHTAGCGAAGDIISFIAGVLKTTRSVVFADLKRTYDLSAPKSISLETVEKYHEAIWNHKPLLSELRKRCVTDDTIKTHRLGVFRGRITIPVFDSEGRCINIRRYLPGALNTGKMRNIKGYGTNALYPIGQLEYPEILVCGGEVKALVASSLLNEHNIGAISTTAGEGSWHPDFNSHFVDKKVYVCFDIDSAGIKAANKICCLLYVKCEWVGNLSLPLDFEKYPHGDINDWVAEGGDANELLRLFKATAKWEPQAVIEIDTSEAIDVELTDSVAAENVGKLINVEAMITAMDESPYVIPKKVMAMCGRNQPCCDECPIYLIPRNDDNQCEAIILANSPSILDMIESPKRLQHGIILEALKIPPCKDVKFEAIEYHNVEDLRLSTRLEISNVASNHMIQQAMYVGRGIALNENYEMKGRMYPHPKTQQSVLLITEKKPVSDTLTNYKPTPEALQALEIFNPKRWAEKELQEKLDEIYFDLEENVTKIFMRRQLHVVLDLGWHSVLLIDYENKPVKGWTEILVLGDSAQGKSETTLKLMDHYGLGEKVEMKNATVAGLLGGLHQLGNRWFVSWGTIPTHDRRLVILEELKGAHPKLIAKLTDMRSSGIAEIPKIQRRKTHARTRLIALSNPRSDRPISAYNFGIEAVKELIGNLEDIRRFDLIIMLSADDVDSKIINEPRSLRTRPPHVYTNQLCKECVLWAWTRKSDQVEIDDEVMSLLLEEATKLCDTFTEEIPIVDKGSIRLKVLRLSTALACRTFSHKNYEIVVVRRCHVLYIVNLLRDIYSSKAFGYGEYSRMTKSMTQLINVDLIKQKIIQTPFPSDMIRQMLHSENIELRDICDWCAWGMEDAAELLSLLVRKHALKRVKNAYQKTPQFIELLKQIEGTAEQRPEFIGESDEF